MDDPRTTTSQPALSRRALLEAGGKVAAGVAAAGALGGVAAAPRVLATGTPASTQTQITFWFFDPWPQHYLIDAFHQKNPHIKVNFNLLGYDDLHKKLLTSLAAGSGAPDLTGIDLGYIGTFTSKGGLVDLRQAPYHADRLKGDMVAYKWAEGSTSDGRLVGLPWDVGPAGLWYRADLFKAAALDTNVATMQARIKTWDALFQLGMQLRKKTPKVALLADPVNDIFSPMVEQQGHGWFNGTKVLIVQKATRPLQMAVKASKMGITANLAAGSPEWAAGFKKNAFAAQLAACWSQASLTRDQPQTIGQWRAIHAPGGDYSQGGSFLAIPEQSNNKEAAWAFATFIGANPTGSNIGFKKAGGVFPSYKPAWKDPVYDQPSSYFGGQRVNQLWRDVAQHVPATRISPYERQANDIVLNEVTNALKQGKDPVQAMKDAQQAVLQRIPGTTA